LKTLQFVLFVKYYHNYKNSEVGGHVVGMGEKCILNLNKKS